MPFPAAASPAPRPVTRRRLTRSFTRRSRRTRLGLAFTPVAALAAAATTTATAPTAAAAGILPPADPPTSIPWTASMQANCAPGGSAACDQAALAGIDAARASEGVGPISLPDNWSTLSAEQQLFVLTNLERVDRGLPPILGLDNGLDSSAESAAAAGTDPTGPAGSSWWSTWAGGEPGVLTADYDWLYNDGPNSNNVACPPSCWGHRNALLVAGTALYMGAGHSGANLTTLIASGYAGTAIFPWSAVVPQLHPLLPTSVNVGASPGGTGVAAVTVGASGTSTAATASVTGPGLSMAVPSCSASPGTSCNLVVAFSASAAGRSAGSLTVQAAGGTYTLPVSAVAGHGYWQATTNGVVYGFGGSGWEGDLGAVRLARPIVGMASTPDHGGYWLVAADGGIFAFGDANYYGSTGAMRLNRPIVGMAATPSGHGYWLVASDGGIFSFGDAAFRGSTGAMRLNQPIVGMAATPTGMGYWLVASDGGIFGFGDAAFRGSTGAMRLNQPVVGMASTPTGRGYWLAASDGGIFSFGDAAFHGSTGNLRLVRPVTSLVAAPGGGYWEMASDGGVFAFAAPYLGSAAGSGMTVAAGAAS